MLINCDAKSLEWVVAIWLSQDPVGMEELRREGFDFHGDNQKAFSLPSRLIAKIYLFRMIFGGSAWSYANDADFMDVPIPPKFKKKEKYWESVIEATYRKYKGLHTWHTDIVREVSETGKLLMPTGRVYTYTKTNDVWPRTQILNYPVQGLGADIMSIIRVSLFKRMKKAGMKALLISTIHDSILIDSTMDEVNKICRLIYEVFEDMPINFKRLFGVEFNVPLRVEIQVGETWGNMSDITKEQVYANPS